MQPNPWREALFDANVINKDPQKYLNINRIIETKNITIQNNHQQQT